MGNNQSTGHHNRLSKPKTNTNSPFSTPKQLDSPGPVPSKDADLSSPDPQQLKKQLTSPVESEFSSMLYSDGDDGIGELATHVQLRLSNLPRSNSVASRRGSVPNSTARLSSLPGSKLSLASDTQTVDLDTAIKILEEVRKNASPEDLAALHQALQPSASPSPAPSHGLNPNAAAINRSTSSLIRRRSLVVTPGVATRTSPIEAGRRKWNSWVTPPVELQQKWQVEMMGTSPLTRLAALDLAEEARGSPTPRARTPGDTEYTQLGSLKHGSLVVTNGAPSPAPSAKNIQRRRSNPDFAQEEDYFTASEGRSSPVKWMEAGNKNHARSKSSTLPTMLSHHRQLQGILSDERKAKTLSRCDSPLKVQSQSRQIFEEVSEDEEGQDIEVESIRKRLHVVNKSADTLARDYMAEIATSPFETSKGCAAEDHDEGFAESLSDDAKSFREEAFRILDGTIFNEPVQAPALESPKPPTEHAPDPKPSRLRRNRRPSPKKADSGYFSGGSFRQDSAKKEGTVPVSSPKEGSVADSQKSGHVSDSDDATSLYTFEQMLALPTSRSLPPIPTGKDVEDRTPERPARLSIPESKFIQASPSSKSPVVKTPQSVASKFSIDTNASVQNRLQKRRPPLQALPVVQSCQPVAEGTIPGIPDNVKSQFVRRLSGSPAMECLTRTYLPKDDVNAEESVTDSPALASFEFSFPSTSPAPRGRHHKRSHTERAPTPPPHGVRRSLSFLRRKPHADTELEGKREDVTAPTTFRDLGTVANALGSSPYDVAMSAVPKQQTVISPTHPHQLGNALPRAGSMVNMDAYTDVALARLKSKDGAVFRPEMPRRPMSYHDVNMDARDASAFERRLHSVYAKNELVPTVVRELEGMPNETLEPEPMDTRRLFPICASTQRTDEHADSTEAKPSSSFRARSTGRGPVVSQLIDQYDMRGQECPRNEGLDWQPHSRLWNQRRKSVGDGLRQRAEFHKRSSTIDLRASSPRVEEKDAPMGMPYDRYSGGLDYGYERGFGIGGSAGTRQLHSAASRKSTHFSNQYGVDLSDVPVFLQRVHS